MERPTGSFFAGASGAASAGDGRAEIWLTSFASALFSCADWRAAWADHIQRQVNGGHKPFGDKQVSWRHPHLLTDSLFYKLGDLFPGTQRDSHLFQILDCAQEL